MTRSILIALWLAFCGLLIAQRPVAPGQITEVSGDGHALVTTTGPQTPGCVRIDANGNHVPTGLGCAVSIGAVGPTGPAGPVGATGVGVAGPAGPSGSNGAAGATGAAGAAATVAVGFTANGLPGTDAGVANGGTSSAAVLNFVIPRGAPGATGPSGSNGTNGTNGSNGSTGPAGPAGPTGPTGPGGSPGGTITPTTGALKGDGSGGGIPVSGAGSNFVHVDGSSSAGGANAVVNNGANTGTSAMTLDMSAAAANSFKIPATSGGTASADGSMFYDYTVGVLHFWQVGDAYIPISKATPADGDCTKWVVVGTQRNLGTTGAPCGGGGGTTLTTKGDLQGFSTVAARIPVGTNGQVMTADSTQALGLKWAAGTPGPTGPAGTNGTNGAAGTPGQGNNTYCADATGSTTTYTCPSPAPTVSTLTGLLIVLTPQATNTGTSTVNVASLGAKTLKQADGSTNIASGALVGGTGYAFQYDGANFRQVSSGGGGGGGGASSSIQLTDFLPSFSSGTITFQPGVIRFGSMTCTNFTAITTANATVSAGSGTAKVFITPNCAIALLYPSSVTASWTLAGMTAAPVASPIVPSDSFYLAEVSIGLSALTAVSDKRGNIGKDPLVAGLGIVVDTTLGPSLVSVDPATVALLGGTNAFTGTLDATASTISKSSRTVSADPSGACTQANEIVLSMASGNPFSCKPTTPPDCGAGCAWHAMGGGGGGSSPLTTKGDVYTRSSSADARLAVGSDGQVLTADTASTNGVKWATPSGGGGTSQFLTQVADTASTSPGIIVQSTALPVLASGACWGYEIYYVTQANANYGLTLWFGTNPGSTGDTLVSANYTGTGGNAFDQLYGIARGRICNKIGTQTQQNAIFETPGPSIVTVSSIVGTNGHTTTWTQDTSAADKKIGIEMTTGAEFVTVMSFRVWLVQ